MLKKYIKSNDECLICLEQCKKLIKVDCCKALYCNRCYDKIITIKNSLIWDRGEKKCAVTYMYLEFKCSMCRKQRTFNMDILIIKQLKLTNRLLIKKLLDFNFQETKKMWYELDNFRSDEEDFEVEMLLRITGHHRPIIEQHQLITQMLSMGLRNFNFYN